MNAVEIYHSLIGDKLKPMIVEYTPYSDNYRYFPYHHVFDPDFEKSFIDLIFNSIIFYAFEKNEIEKDYEGWTIYTKRQEQHITAEFLKQRNLQMA